MTLTPLQFKELLKDKKTNLKPFPGDWVKINEVIYVWDGIDWRNNNTIYDI